MSLVPSLLRAVVSVGGHALVLQAGEKPYVSSPTGPIDLPGTGLTADAIGDVIGQLLPPESQNVLTQFGAVQYDLAESTEFPGEQFRVTATNEGTALGVEIRRLRAVPASSPVTANEPVSPPPRTRQSDRGVALPPSPRRDRPAPAEPPVTNASALPVLSGAPPVAEAPVAAQSDAGADLLERLLQAVFAEGATTLYLRAGARPWFRRDDDLCALDGAAPLSALQIDTILMRAPGGGASAVAGGREWFWEFPDHGRVRCTSFRDHGGPGLVLRSVPTRPPTSRQLGLSREVEGLVARVEGLVVVAAPRIGDAHALVAALVDVINRTRRVHVIAIEREVTAIHECEASLVSQREAGPSLDRALELSKAALREDPDVLVLDTMMSADLMSVALEAARSGRLVLCVARGSSVSGVLDDLLGLYSSAQRQKTQMALSQVLVGVVVETSGAPSAQGTRELLINTPESAYLIADGLLTGLGHPNRRG